MLSHIHALFGEVYSQQSRAATQGTEQQALLIKYNRIQIIKQNSLQSPSPQSNTDVQMLDWCYFVSDVCVTMRHLLTYLLHGAESFLRS